MEGSNDRRIVLVGKMGAGKSSVCNSVLGEDVFTTSDQANSKTSTCEAKTKTIDGRKITVVDTPGFFSTDRSDKELKPEIAKCIVECSPGPHAFLIILTVTRQTPEEIKVVEEILKMFGDETQKYAVVLFTHGDQLENGKTIRMFVDDNKHLTELVQKCGDRLHVIDNKYWKHPIIGHGGEPRNVNEIKELWKTIDEMVTQNKGKHYTNETLEAVAKAIEVETVKIREKTGKQISVSTAIERAKETVRRLLIQATGMSTGLLLGALLGAVASVAIVAAAVCLMVKMSPAGAGAVVAMVAGAEGVAAGAVAGLGAAAAVGAGAAAGGIVGAITGARVAEEAQTCTEAAESTFRALKIPAVAAAELVKKKME